MQTMTIGELAQATGLAPRTIRFYEQKGLLPRPPRSEGGYRQYSAEDLRRLGLLRRVRALGFSLSEARGLLRLAEDNGCGSFQSELAGRLEHKLVEVDRLLEELAQTRRSLHALSECLSQEPCGDCQQTAIECLTDASCLGA